MENIEIQLKELIQSKYKSLRDFSMQIDMPYTTLDSIFKRGISNSSVSNIIKICNALDISADALARNELLPSEIENKPVGDPNELSDLQLDIALFKMLSNLRADEVPQVRAFVQGLIAARKD